MTELGDDLKAGLGQAIMYRKGWDDAIEAAAGVCDDAAYQASRQLATAIRALAKYKREEQTDD